MFDKAINLKVVEDIWDTREKYLQFLEGEVGKAAKLTTREQDAAEARSQLTNIGVNLSEIVHAEYLNRVDDKFAYYYLPIPLTIFPPEGTFIQSVQIELYFNPGSNERPTVYDIFPRQEWQDKIRLEGGLQIGIDDALKFAWMITSSSIAAPVSPFIKSLLDMVQGSKDVLSTDYAFLIRKPIIMTSTEGSDVAFWRFNGRDHFEQAEHLKFGVVLAVPLHLKTVRIVKKIKARRRNQSLRRRLAHDLERIQKTQEILKRVFQESEINAVIEQLKQFLQNDWNIVQADLQLWNLDPDMVH